MSDDNDDADEDAALAAETSFWRSLLEQHDSILDAYAFFQQQSPKADSDDDDFSEGEYVVYMGRRAAAPRAAVVRYVGELGGRPSVGIEFVADGYSESCGARGFTCEPGRGLYLSGTGAARKLLPVTDVDHSNEEWRQAAVQDIMQHLEQRAHSAGEATLGRSSAAPEKEVVEFNYISMRQLTRGIERLECLAPQQSQDIFNRFGGRVGHLSQADFIAAWSRWQAVRLPRDLAAIRSSALKRFRAPPRPQGDSIRYKG